MVITLAERHVTTTIKRLQGKSRNETRAAMTTNIQRTPKQLRLNKTGKLATGHDTFKVPGPDFNAALNEDFPSCS
eukprot:11637463-Heterocapsa_arctica.AAC.1